MVDYEKRVCDDLTMTNSLLNDTLSEFKYIMSQHKHEIEELKKKVSLEMYLDQETVSNPRIAPDGQRIVYARGWIDKMNDRRKSSIWIMNADGTRNHFLVDGSGPIWSPDGSRIAFTASDESDDSQIFVRWMDDEGATTQITRLEKSPSNVAWAPDGNTISFTMNVEAAPAWTVNPPGRPEGANWTAARR